MVRINDNRKEKVEFKAKKGDLIKINGSLCLVLDRNKWRKEGSVDSLSIAIINYSSGSDYMELASDYQTRFEKGSYEMYAKKGTWGIELFDN